MKPSQSQVGACWRILKAPPANPRFYIYRYYNIDPKEGLKYVRKALKSEKRLTMVYAQEKRLKKML